MDNHSAEPLVYAVILNWNSYKETLSLVKQLKSIPYKYLRILVVDNYSTRDNSPKHLKAIAAQSFELICNNKNLGYAGGNNTGINAAISKGADFVWILNPDIRIEPSTLKLMLDTATSSDQIAATGSRICFRSDHNLIFTDGGMVYPEQGYLVKHLHNKHRRPLADEKEIYEVDYANGSSILINANAAKAIGTFREDFFLYFEEAEWCLRAKQSGWRICTDTRAVVYHSPSQKGSNYHYYMSRNRILLSRIMDNGKHRHATLRLELKRMGIYIKEMVLGTLLHRTRILFAKFRGIVHGLFRKIK